MKIKLSVNRKFQSAPGGEAGGNKLQAVFRAGGRSVSIRPRR